MIAAQSLSGPDHPEFLGLVLDRLHRYQDWHPAFLAGLLADAGPDAGPMLQTALGDETRAGWSRAVVAQALLGLRDLASADTAGEVLGRSDDPELLVACLKLLVEVGESRHRVALLPMLNSPHFPVRSYALKALGAVGTGEDLPEFVEALKDESPWVALEAARGLRALGGSEILEKLALSGGPRSPLALQVMSE
jgi:HEAT repeat protein